MNQNDYDGFLVKGTPTESKDSSLITVEPKPALVKVAKKKTFTEQELSEGLDAELVQADEPAT